MRSDVRMWRTRAFGIEIDTSVEAPGLPPAADGAPGPATRLEIVDRETIDREWRHDESERVLEERLEGPAPDRTIDFHPALGYRLYARGYGLARISLDGMSVVCSPPAVSAWRWQRFLVGRVLPWAALLRGLEVLHASAVCVDGAAVAFVGDSGSGKTSLALRLVLAGAGFITDDVLAVERKPHEIVAHPGAAISAVRPSERAAIASNDWQSLGMQLGHSDKTYVALERETQARPLGAVYFLRGAEGGAEPIEPIERPDPRLLLASTFVASVRSPQRLLNHLEVCAELARRVPLYWLTVDDASGSADLAEAVTAHLASLR